MTRVLVVDDEADIRTFLRVTLELSDYEVLEAVDGVDAIERALAEKPDLIVMDVMMPRLDGVDACRRMRADARTSDIPILIVTAKSMAGDKVEGLEAGADDYISKPFDPDELLARVQATLRRVNDSRSVSPLTGLPGNTRIQHEITRRVENDGSFALLYADLNDFKAFNDKYGWLRGDEVIGHLAKVLTTVAAGLEGSFVGHVGGDDMILICPETEYEAVADDICRRFDDGAAAFYDENDRARGYIEVEDRRGELRRFPIVTVSIGVAHTRATPFEHPSWPVHIATDMKSYAKQTRTEASNWAADKRARPLPP
ncbi:MAG: response regulator [Actinobacteria bacterium]|nr:response regulator [Actinomycetota bacterium]